ncbi:MAG: ppiB [Planctomycetaceae bacterium]|nr:ppiB [Planctomycetaceae bacterium]
MPTVGQLSRVMVLAGFLWMATTVVGQDQPAPKATKSAPAASAEAKEFQELFAVRAQLSAKLSKLQGPLREAAKAQDVKKHKALVDEFNGYVTDFEEKTLPRLLALAGPLYLKDGKNAEAEEIVLGYLQDLYHENKYKQVVTEGGKYLAAGRTHPLILNFVGVSQYATMDFVKAEETLKQAKAAGAKSEEAASMFSQIGAPYLDQCKPYQAMWVKEQAIRAKEAAATGDARLPHVLFKTNKGDIELELFENEAPNSVANFVNLVEKKKYDGIAFHRVIPNFMAQGGDPNTLDKDPSNDGMGGPGYHIACECYQPNARMHFQGSLSMAHAGKDSGGSQFFLTHLPTSHLNPNVDEAKGHTVFGRIVKGLDVALGLRPGDRIITATVLFKRNHPYVPKTSPE